ncbi:MAG: Asp-tRNA(Asn)/Glu-tRNA(Gln) amidotransferase subunit GatB [Candidatus Omnitrophota bacterium]|jgi:aspartyl-tRNA(Asn)/glutamyl-tRNA(Gln) amidotransferase subunit B|nr:MAG: Asp-tRNA(Asn)/Glu-tRNA(Gln) amidotransferase subunit GatB [Candidatus Omnitrophota bacterium]
MKYEPVIGLETHVELASKSKVFCRCKAEFGGQPNSYVCPVCLGLPGTLPVLNKISMEMSLIVALALHCDIPEVTIFDRKNYYYPDLPKNYQISQEYCPLARNGRLTIQLKDEREKEIGIHNIHLEEDAGKNFHSTGGKQPTTLVDLNRAGTSLLEIVSQPDLRNAEETEAFMQTVRCLLRYLEVSDCKMQEGSLRFELNISLRPCGVQEYGTKVEVKNVGSVKAVLRALDYEMARQAEILDEGGRVVQETRLWDDTRGETRPMRVKEGAKDYRYFPEPDLLPVRLEREYLDALKNRLPELRDAKCRRFIETYQIPPYDAGVLAADKTVADFFEECCRLHAAPKTFSNWIMVHILRELREDSEIGDLPITPQHLAELVRLVESDAINSNIAKKVITEMMKTGNMPADIVKEKGLEAVSDSGEIEQFVEETIAENPGPAEEFKDGKDKAMNFLLGQVMRKSRGKADPQLVQELLRQKLRG